MKTIRNLLYLIPALLLVTILNAQVPPQYGTPSDAVPDPRDAVIYQVNMRCFSAEGNFQSVTDKLGNIRALGVNVLYLMPVQPVGTLNAFNSPYCINDFKAVNPEFGTLADLRDLIDSAHAKGIAVLMDWVANQTSWDHPWITEHPDWYVRIDGVIQQLDGYDDIAALDLENPSARAAMIDAMKYWIYAVNCDGYRFDYANRASAGFWTEAIDSLRAVDTHDLLLFAEGDRSANYTAGFDYNFSWNFYGKMKQIKNGSAVTLIDEANISDYTGATGNQQIVRWLSNHDIYGSEGSPFTIFGGRNGTLAAFVVTATMKGVPFIYNGMEVGNTVDLPFPFTGSDINWEEDLSVTPEMTNILTFRNQNAAIRRGSLTNFSNADVCAFKKVQTPDSVYVFINLRNTVKSFALPAELTGRKMFDMFTGDPEDLNTTLELEAYQYRILADSGMVTPASTIAISKDSITIDGTGSEQLTAIVGPAEATYKTVFWESGNPGLVRVNAAGLVTGISPGNTFVVAHALNHNITDTCFVSLTGIAVSGISLGSNEETMSTGETRQLTFTIEPEDATNKNVSWSTSDEAIVKVSTMGMLTGISSGIAEIVVTTEDGNKTDTCTVTVEEGTGGFTVYFTKPSDWGSAIKIYYWDPTPGGILTPVNWPGVPMTSLGEGIYRYYFPTISATNLIFNDGSNQTGNLYRDKDGWYIDDVWYDSVPVFDAIDPQVSGDELILYPNPAGSGQVMIVMKDPEPESAVRLLDLNGRCLLQTTITPLQYTLDVSAIREGIYLITIFTSQGAVNRKLIIQ